MAKPKRLPLSNENPVGTIDISPDGRHVVVGQQSLSEADVHLSIWSLDDLSEVKALLRGGNVFITKARYSADGSSIAYLNSRLELWFYDLKKGRVIENELDGEPIHWLSYSQKESLLLLAGTSTRVWNPETHKTIWTLPGDLRNPEEPPAIGVLTADGKKVAIAGLGKEVVVYNLKTKKVLQRLGGGPTHASWIAADARMNYVAVVDEDADGTFLWDVECGEKMDSAYVNENAKGYSCMAFQRQGDLLGLGMRLGFIEVLSIAADEYILEEEAHDGRVSDVVFTPDGARFITGGVDGAVYVWELG